MQIVNNTLSWQLSLSDALVAAASEYRSPSAGELRGAIAALAKLTSKAEASAPEMVRRLVTLNATGEPGLLVAHPTHCPDLGAAAAIPGDALAEVPCALPLSAGVAVLQDPNGPEAILAQRRQFVADVRAREQARAEEETRAANARRAAREKLAADRAEFRADEWEALSETQRFGILLARTVASTDPATATSIRAIVRTLIAGAPFPRGNWWTGTLEAPSATTEGKAA